MSFLGPGDVSERVFPKDGHGFSKSKGYFKTKVLLELEMNFLNPKYVSEQVFPEDGHEFSKSKGCLNKCSFGARDEFSKSKECLGSWKKLLA